MGSAGEQYLALWEAGHSYGDIAKQFGVSRCAVAGAIFRTRHPQPQKWRGHFRDPDHVREVVALADAIGLCRAARMLGMDPGHLCRWRQRLREMEAA